jgi:hypothetical protein
MLDSSLGFTVPGVEAIVVYPDDALRGGFYLVAQRPGLARGTDGEPEIELTVYGRRQANGSFQPSGGLLSLTTVLDVSASVRVQAERALAARLAADEPSDSTPAPPTPTLLAPEWIDAAVHVKVTGGAAFDGQPSLIGDNRCSISASISGDQITDLLSAWSAGLPGGTIAYRGQIRAGRGPATTAAASVSTRTRIEQGVLDAARTSQVSVSAASRTSDLEVSATGPLCPPGLSLADRLHSVEL